MQQVEFLLAEQLIRLRRAVHFAGRTAFFASLRPFSMAELR